MSRIKDHICIFTNWIRYVLHARSISYVENKDKKLGLFLMSLKKKIRKTDYSPIEKTRNHLLKDSTRIEGESFGGGSRIMRKNKSVSEVARKVAVRKKYGRLLNAVVHELKSPVVLELGTSIGISALYLAFENSCKVATVEGNNMLVEIAKKAASHLNLRNIEFVCGDFDDLLPELIKELPEDALVYIDGNHTYEATLRYYYMLREVMPNGILIFDDIYWSRGMKRAWEEIIMNENLVLDLFQFGIVLPSGTSIGYYRVRY